MQSILVYKQLSARTVPLRFDTVYDAAEYLYRAHAEAVVLPLSTSDSENTHALRILTDLPLDDPPRLYTITDRPICSTLPEQVSFCFYAPITEERLFERIKLFRPDHAPNLIGLRRMDRYCSEMLLSLGVSPNLTGFTALRLALLYLLQSPDPTGVRMMDELYATVAQRMETNCANVEHAMRNAIETAWLRTDLTTIESYFGYTTKLTKSTPSNAAFLYALNDRIRLQLSDRTDAILSEIRRLESLTEKE